MAELTGKFFEGVGRRKTSVARVRLYSGQGTFTVNEKPMAEYFTRIADLATVQAPLAATGAAEKYLVSVLVQGGGGPAGQARRRAPPGLARALLKRRRDAQLIPAQGRLPDAMRIKERKPGLKRARKAKQYTKR
jgi:small subunit ribosomal protein S9